MPPFVVTVPAPFANATARLRAIGRQFLPVRIVDATTLGGSWASVLAVGATSGGTSPIISDGDHLEFPRTGIPLPAVGNIRVSDVWSLVGRNVAPGTDVTLLNWGGGQWTVGNPNFDSFYAGVRLRFYDDLAAPVGIQTIVGAKAGNVALANLLTALEAANLIIDHTGL